MAHPLVDQFRFTRSEWLRGLQGVSEEDGARHFGPMNCIGWNVGHLAWHEQRTFLWRPQGTILFPKLGIADQIAGKSRKVRGPPSGEPVAAVVARGEAEVGFQQVAELIHVPGITFVGRLPDEIQPEIFFAGAITKTARDPEAARALLRFLTSPEAAPVISKAGLTPLGKSP